MQTGCVSCFYLSNIEVVHKYKLYVWKALQNISFIWSTFKSVQKGQSVHISQPSISMEGIVSKTTNHPQQLPLYKPTEEQLEYVEYEKNAKVYIP